MGQHGAGRDVGRAGRPGRRGRTFHSAGAVRRRSAGRCSGTDGGRGRAGGPVRGRGCGLGRRQGELGHPLPENHRGHDGKSGVGKPGRFSVDAVPQERRDGALHFRRVHRQRLQVQPGLQLHRGQVQPLCVRHQGQGRTGRAVHPQPVHG